MNEAIFQVIKKYFMDVTNARVCFNEPKYIENNYLDFHVKLILFVCVVVMIFMEKIVFLRFPLE